MSAKPTLLDQLCSDCDDDPSCATCHDAGLLPITPPKRGRGRPVKWNPDDTRRHDLKMTLADHGRFAALHHRTGNSSFNDTVIELIRAGAAVWEADGVPGEEE